MQTHTQGGETIKGLQKQFGTSVQIDQSCQPCRITVAGPGQSVMACVAAIEDVIEDRPQGGMGMGMGMGMAGVCACVCLAVWLCVFCMNVCVSAIENVIEDKHTRAHTNTRTHTHKHTYTLTLFKHSPLRSHTLRSCALWSSALRSGRCVRVVCVQACVLFADMHMRVCCVRSVVCVFLCV